MTLPGAGSLSRRRSLGVRPVDDAARAGQPEPTAGPQGPVTPARSCVGHGLARWRPAGSVTRGGGWSPCTPPAPGRPPRAGVWRPCHLPGWGRGGGIRGLLGRGRPGRRERPSRARMSCCHSVRCAGVTDDGGSATKWAGAAGADGVAGSGQGGAEARRSRSERDERLARAGAGRMAGNSGPFQWPIGAREMAGRPLRASPRSCPLPGRRGQRYLVEKLAAVAAPVNRGDGSLSARRPARSWGPASAPRPACCRNAR